MKGRFPYSWPAQERVMPKGPAGFILSFNNRHAYPDTQKMSKKPSFGKLSPGQTDTGFIGPAE
jgi:hypothetical protein